MSTKPRNVESKPLSEHATLQPQAPPQSPQSAPPPPRRRRRKSVNDADVAKIICLLYSLCRDGVEENSERVHLTATGIAARVRDEFAVSIDHHNVLLYLCAAMRMGFLPLAPPPYATLNERLATIYAGAKQHDRTPDRRPRSLQVVDVCGPGSTRAVAAAAAWLVLERIKEIARKRREKREGERVGLGLGVGWTTEAFAQAFAESGRSDPDVPPLRLHALSVPWSVENPIASPHSSFVYLRDAFPDVEMVGLIGGSFVPEAEYGSVLRHPTVMQAFAKRDQIDVVVTSLASAADPHGYFRRYLEVAGGEEGLKLLAKKHGVADLHLRPYSKHGPIDSGLGTKALCLFEIRDLVEFASQPDKSVFVLVAPCAQCPSDKPNTKADAVLPLLVEPKLRLWTDILLSRDTASDLVALAKREAHLPVQ